MWSRGRAANGSQGKQFKAKEKIFLLTRYACSCSRMTDLLYHHRNLLIAQMEQNSKLFENDSCNFQKKVSKICVFIRMVGYN